MEFRSEGSEGPIYKPYMGQHSVLGAQVIQKGEEGKYGEKEDKYDNEDKNREEKSNL